VLLDGDPQTIGLLNAKTHGSFPATIMGVSPNKYQLSKLQHVMCGLGPPENNGRRAHTRSQSQRRFKTDYSLRFHYLHV
jgi:hypothetical protein